MTTPSDGLRRDAETTRLLGGRLVLVDGAAVIAKARRERVAAVPHRALPAARAERRLQPGKGRRGWPRGHPDGGRRPHRWLPAAARHHQLRRPRRRRPGQRAARARSGQRRPGGPADRRPRRAGRGRAHQAAAHVLAAGRRLTGLRRPARRGRRRRPARHDLLQRRARRQGQPRRPARRRRQPRRVDPGRRPRRRGHARPPARDGRADAPRGRRAGRHGRAAARPHLRGQPRRRHPRAGRRPQRRGDARPGRRAAGRGRPVPRDRRLVPAPGDHGPVGRPPAAGHPDVRPARHRQDHAGPGAGQRDRRRLPRDPHPGDPRQVARRLRAQHQADLPGGPAIPGAHRDALRRVRQHHQLRGRRRRRGQPGGQRGRGHLQAGDERPHRGQPERDRRGDHQLPAPGRRLADPLRPLRHQAVDPAARRERPSGDLHQEDPRADRAARGGRVPDVRRRHRPARRWPRQATG